MMQMQMKFLIFSCAFNLLVLTDIHAGQRHAILVGVTQPDHFLHVTALQGVKTDISLMQEIAQTWGVKQRHLHILASWQQATAQPTAVAVQDAFARLLDEVHPGDEVLLYFSGHGTNQPSAFQDEQGNVEAVFLLQDSKPWTADSGKVGNAITSSNLRQQVRELGQRGAFVWLIVDSCHAAVLRRGAQDAPHSERDDSEWDIVSNRFMSPKFPYEKADPAFIHSKVKQVLQNKSSQLWQFFPGFSYRKWPKNAQLPPMLAFYATSEDQDASEIQLKSSGQRAGLFTWILHTEAKKMFVRQGIHTYHDLAKSVLAAFKKIRKQVNKPVFIGNEWDRLVWQNPTKFRR